MLYWHVQLYAYAYAYRYPGTGVPKHKLSLNRYGFSPSTPEQCCGFFLPSLLLSLLPAVSSPHPPFSSLHPRPPLCVKSDPPSACTRCASLRLTPSSDHMPSMAPGPGQLARARQPGGLGGCADGRSARRRGVSFIAGSHWWPLHTPTHFADGTQYTERRLGVQESRDLIT